MSLCRAVVASEDEPLALPVYQVQPAQPAVAGWLRNLLTPVVSACGLRNTYPVEFRPTGLWGGWADSSDSAPDRRVAISNLALHRTKRGLVTTFLHEVAHHLTGIEHGHDAAFFAVNLMLLVRVSAASEVDSESIGALADTMSLYDLKQPPAALQHEPDAGVGRAVSWAIRVAHELAPTPMTAEDVAAEIRTRYAAWIAQLAAAPAAAAARAQTVADAAASAKATRDELQRTTGLLRSVSIWLGVAGTAVLAEAFMLLKLAFGGA